MAEQTTTAAETEYKERYVAVLDLLGLKMLVDAAERDAKEQKRLKKVLVLLSQTLSNNPRLGSGACSCR